MSYLNHAKTKAKRLLKVAQSEKGNILKIPNLASAYETVAILNGYHSWKVYEQNLSKQDRLQGRVLEKDPQLPDSEFSQEDYYHQNLEFKIERGMVKNSIISEHNATAHTVVELGRNKSVLGTKIWGLNNFPMAVSGTIGSGKNDFLISLMSQWIGNGEGGILIEAGDISTYGKVCGHVLEANRSDDLFLINTIKGDSNFTHTIDIISELLANQETFETVFGEEIGPVMYKIAIHAQAESMVLNSSHLEAMLMIPNLIHWKEKGTFGEDASVQIDQYLTKWQDKEDFILLHDKNCRNAKNLVEVIKEYEKKGIFSSEPDIRLSDIMCNQKILIVMLPFFEKLPENLINLSNLLLASIYGCSKGLHRQFEKSHLQNIVMNYFQNFLWERLYHLMVSHLPASCNWVFGIEDLYIPYNRTNNIYSLMSASNTIVFLKTEWVSHTPEEVVGKIMTTVPKGSNIFHTGSGKLNLKMGKGYVYSSQIGRMVSKEPFYNSGNSDFFEKVDLINIPTDITYYLNTGTCIK